eukprot:scaffold96898_cov22-Tisochrysis_lutea.AAC.1
MALGAHVLQEAVAAYVAGDMVELVVFNGFPIPGHQWGDGCSKLVMKLQQSQVNVLSMKFLACVPGIAHLPIAVWEWEVFSGRHHPYPPEISDMKKG